MIIRFHARTAAIRFHARTAAILAMATLALSGCANMAVAPPVVSLETLQVIQASGIPPVKVGAFLPGPDLPAQADRGLQARGGVARPPNGRSFAAYLGETLAAELAGANRLDPASDIEISGFLVDSRLDADGFKVGTGSVGARFIVRRQGVVVFDRVLVENGRWESSFLGANAIPAAVQGYHGLYARLVRRLLSDPEFTRAVKGG